MTGYNIQSQKIHAEGDRKQKKRKSGNGNVFKNLIKIVVNLFGKTIISFFYAADPEIFSCMGQFFNKEGETRLKLVLQPNFWLQIGWYRQKLVLASRREKKRNILN